MIDDLLLRWVVTALFVVSAAECTYATVAHRGSWTHVVSHSLHAVMAAAMAVMAWPRGAALPTTAPMVFFSAATLWFVILTFAQSGHRLVNTYHALMMLAMAWMYAVMSGGLQAQPSGAGGAGGGGHHGSHATSTSMPGMDMPGMEASAAHDPYPPFVIALNWLCTVGFAVAAIWWVYRYFARRRTEASAPASQFFGIACQAMMAAGMAIMFGVML